MQQPGLCLWLRLGSALSPWPLRRSLLRPVRPSSTMVVLTPVTTLEALVQLSAVSASGKMEGGRTYLSSDDR